MKPHTQKLLQHTGLGRGHSFLDNGCGGGHVAIMAAIIAGSQGKVTGVDFDESIIQLARQDAELESLPQLSFATMNAYDLPFNNDFDFVYARFLLSHLNNPLLALQKMVQAAKPGGTIVIEDVHFGGHYCYPANTAFQQYQALYSQAARLKGGDSEIGPQLPSLLKMVGLEDIEFDTIQPAFSEGEGKMMAYLTLDRIKDSLLQQQQLITAEELDLLLSELKLFCENSDSVISFPRIFRAWGKVSR